FAQSFTTHQLCVQKSDGTPVCITGDQLASVLASAGESVATSSGMNTSVATTTIANTSDASSTIGAPAVEINGNNPASIHVGDAYNDLGATITGPERDLNLGVQTFVNGTLMNPISIDTRVAATDTIEYVVTDQNGLTSTSTRIVIV